MLCIHSASQPIALWIDFTTMALRPTPMMMRPPGLGGPPQMPGSPVGGPGGPGATKMLSPGSGAGMKAAAVEQIKECMRNIQRAGLSFDPGSKEFNAVMGSLRTLNGIFGKPSDADLRPAARARMAPANLAALGEFLGGVILTRPEGGAFDPTAFGEPARAPHSSSAHTSAHRSATGRWGWRHADARSHRRGPPRHWSWRSRGLAPAAAHRSRSRPDVSSFARHFHLSSNKLRVADPLRDWLGVEAPAPIGTFSYSSNLDFFINERKSSTSTRRIGTVESFSPTSRQSAGTPLSVR